MQLRHLRRETFRRALTGALALCAALRGHSADAEPPARDAGFVRVEHGQFFLDGKPHRFAGVNYWYAPWLGQAGAAGDRARLIRELDRLAELGLDNLRLVALTEASTGSPLTAATQTSAGAFNEAWLDGLDFAVAEVSRRRLRVVLTLANYWSWSGGLGQYVAWSTNRPLVDDRSKWPDFNRYTASFYAEPAAIDLHRQAVAALVMRRNRYTGRLYRDEPAIFAWQLCNEPRPGAYEHTKEFGPALTAWVARAAADLKALGVKQLVSIGSEGLYGCNGDRVLARAINESPNVDYVTVHLWPQNWRWYDPKRAGETFDATTAKALEYLEFHEQIARDFGKPLVLEEFGLPRDDAACTADSPTTYRDRYFAKLGEHFTASLASRGPLQGLNVWSWSGELGPPSPAGKLWRDGDPLMGDNPMEPQGLYSVFSGDTATITWLRGLARQAAK